MVGMWFRSLCRRLLRFSSEREPSFKLDDLDWDSEFVRLGDEEWEKVVKLHLSLLGANNQHVVPNKPQPWADSYRAGTRWVAANHSYKSSGALEAHFGLGRRERVDLQVVLLNGKKVPFKAVAVDKFLELDFAAGRTATVRVATDE